MIKEKTDDELKRKEKDELFEIYEKQKVIQEAKDSIASDKGIDKLNPSNMLINALIIVGADSENLDIEINPEEIAIQLNKKCQSKTLKILKNMEQNSKGKSSLFRIIINTLLAFLEEE